MLTIWCVRACDLNPLMDYYNVKIHDIWERNVTTRRDILTEHISCRKGKGKICLKGTRGTWLQYFSKSVLGPNNHKLHHSTFYGPHNNFVFSPLLFSFTSFICMLSFHNYIIKNEILTRYFFKTSSDVFGHIKYESNHCSIFKHINFTIQYKVIQEIFFSLPHILLITTSPILPLSSSIICFLSLSRQHFLSPSLFKVKSSFFSTFQTTSN